MMIEAWGDTMLTTALLVLAVLLVRKPFARHFGPRLTYTLWLVPALRLILPPLPFADPAVVPAETAAALWVPVEAVPAAATTAEPLWSLAEAMPLLFALWAAGAVAVLASALFAHRRFRRAVLLGGVELEPVGTVRLVMTDAVDGPVAFGLLRRYVAVPADFFARYAAEERALAIDHELTHHRHGDLWANAAALLLLAAQWFNPLAWRALRAFRFDQEAACDARVLTMTDAAPREVRTMRYATAIAKAAVGARLSLAAPMAVHDNLQERLTMLTRQDVSKRRGLAGRLLVGGTVLAVLATTATLVPAEIASASVQVADIPEPLAPPAPLEAPTPPEPPAIPDAPHGAMLIASGEEGTTEHVWTSEDGTRREVRRVVIRESSDSDGEGKAPAVRHLEFAMPGGLSRDDILATLKEQGVTGGRADAIADKLEAKRRARFRTALAPLPPMPPVPPMPAAGWAPVKGRTMAIARCADGKTAPTVDREETDGSKRSRFVMIACSDGPEAKAARLSALKKAREQFRESDGAMSDNMRAKVAADLDKAIADAEKSGD
jgi:beta-lactamase regulating signal transducer with metallopeptidase domain